MYNMSIGIDIYFKDNTIDSVDPVENFTETETEYLFYTGKYEYAFPISEVLCLKPYDPERRMNCRNE